MRVEVIGLLKGVQWSRGGPEVVAVELAVLRV